MNILSRPVYPDVTVIHRRNSCTGGLGVPRLMSASPKSTIHPVVGEVVTNGGGRLSQGGASNGQYNLILMKS